MRKKRYGHTFSAHDEMKVLDFRRDHGFRSDSEEKARTLRANKKEFYRKLLAGEIPARRPPVHARTAKRNVKVVSLASVRLADVEE